MNPISSVICTPCGYVKIQNKNKIISNIKSKNQNNIKQILSDLYLASYKRCAVATSVSPWENSHNISFSCRRPAIFYECFLFFKRMLSFALFVYRKRASEAYTGAYKLYDVGAVRTAVLGARNR